EVKAKGITRIDGDVLIDDRLFARALGSGSGPGLVTPIVVNDNVVDAIISPAAEAGQPATVRMRPETGFVQMDAQVTTVPEGRPTRLDIEAVGAPRLAVPRANAGNAKPPGRIWAVDAPAWVPPRPVTAGARATG